MHKNKTVLQDYEAEICNFLKTIKLTLHPNKCKIIPLSQGITFLGFKVFYHYKAVRKRNLRRIKARISELLDDYEYGSIDAYDVLRTLRGWNGYASFGNSHSIKIMLERMVEAELKRRKPSKAKNRVSYQLLS